MKRFTLFIITLTLTILQSAAQDTSIKGTITLSHQGNETDFAYNEMIKVMMQPQTETRCISVQDISKVILS